jgi:hypothetical protein
MSLAARENLFLPARSSASGPITASSDVPQTAWRTASLFFVLTGVIIVAGGGSLARWGFPVGALLVAYWLYLKAPVTYLSFVWWLWFLSPFVRRLVDYKTGWVDPSPVLLAPQLAILVCAGSIFGDWAIWKRISSLPFLLGFASVAYGLLVGFLSLPAAPVAIAALSWIGPLVLGFHVYRRSQDSRYAALYSDSLQRTFLWGILLMGAYGLYQLIVAPAWDQFWIVNSELVTVGRPEPFEIRLFGTMNAPGPFASALAAGLLVLLVRRGFLPLLASALGYLSLILSLSRSSWLVWVVGMLLLSLRHRLLAVRVILMAVVLIASIAVLSTLDPVREVVEGRIKSFTSLQEDTSYQERRFGYSLIPGYIAAEPAGGGIGVMDLKYSGDPVSLGPHDSTIWELFMSIGWFGAAAYLMALCIIFALVLMSPPSTLFEAAANAVCIGMLSQFLLNSVMSGIPGLCIWTFYGLCMRRSDSAAAAPAIRQWEAT